jgi:RNA polymerase sigma factor (sigma-70 family)
MKAPIPMDVPQTGQAGDPGPTSGATPETVRFLAEHEAVIVAVVGWHKWRFDWATQEDMAQRARMDVARGLASYRGTGRPERWVKQVCIRRCIDEIRRQIRERRLVLKVPVLDQEGEPVVIEPVSGPEHDPRALIWRDELARHLNHLVDLLPETCRRIIHQFYLRHLTYREIAEAEGLAINTVGSRLSKCLDKLRAQAAGDPLMKEYFEA